MVCVLEQGWNKTLQGCGPPGTEFDTPALRQHALVLLFVSILYVYFNESVDIACFFLFYKSLVRMSCQTC